MNVVRWIIAAAALFGAAGAASAARSPLPERIQVEWAPQEQLSEVRDNRLARGWLRPEEWQQALSEHMRRRADRVLPAGEHLNVHVDDIKLAGAFEPWHRPGLDDVRIMKDIYPPMLKLHYTLTAADGSTIREGEAKLRDSSYLQRSVANSTDMLRFDKRMIDEWLSKEFSGKAD